MIDLNPYAMGWPQEFVVLMRTFIQGCEVGGRWREGRMLVCTHAASIPVCPWAGITNQLGPYSH